MSITRVLVANRGEIAVRVVQAARSVGMQAVAVHPEDDAGSRHVAFADSSHVLPGVGAVAYLDVDAVIAAAVATGCDSIHPGYGFLSESSRLAQACIDAGLVFVGPSPSVLGTFGNKVSARRAAQAAGLPVLAATDPDVDHAQAREFLASLGGAGVMVKAVSGGGGRGIRPVIRADALADALEQCRSEALRAFGDGAVYVEEMMTAARHIEVQLIGDGVDVLDLGDRDCSVQRRRQKLVEIAPAPGIPHDLRDRLTKAAVELGRSVGLSGAATVELLVDVPEDRFVFLEVNPRVQVEHTVTEEVTGADIVAAQLLVAGGARLDDLPLAARPEGFAVQVRLNAETVGRDGSVRPSAGRLTAFDLPSGRGIRVDSAVDSGSTVSPRYDSLLAKIVVSERHGELATVLAKVAAALRSVHIGGVSTNVDLLHALVSRAEVAAGTTDTTFVDTHLLDLLDAPGPTRRVTIKEEGSAVSALEVPEGQDALVSPLPGVVVSLGAEPGTVLPPGATVLVIEAMKMEHVIRVETAVELDSVVVAVGDVVAEGEVLALVRPHEGDSAALAPVDALDLDAERPELAELEERLAKTLDGNRPDAVAKRRRTGHRTARENLADLVDPGSFIEYGALVIAAQRRRRPLQDLIDRTPADGLVCGIATVNGARCVVMAYDYTVLAGTQGQYNHRKQARLLEVANREKLPVVLFAEGGGGRPGDTDNGWITGLEEQTFTRFASLSGIVPLVSVVTGRCFAGNAALAGCADVIIATRDASLGMGGPAMIEGGGLGVVAPEDVGPMSVQVPNGVVDVLVKNEAEATAVARQYLGYFTRGQVDGDVVDQRLLRHLVPENRTRSYDVRSVTETLADTGTVLELRPEFGVGVRTWLTRIEGRPVGVVANNPLHLGGAIDSPAADKMARFLQLCDAHGLPIVSLCDTPGFMVGTEAERTASVRRFSRLFVVGAKLRVPICMIILRKGYGLGAMAMAGGSLHTPLATLAWPTGELGPMGLEGGVRLGFRAELEAIEDPDERAERFDELVAEAYQHGKAINVASVYEIDGVIDPAETRSTINRLFDAAEPMRDARRGFVDTW
jgi:acetyl/propionyl-CoA carboxylase alpha subunit/acetyl-CoA carboxylase carboxyltransferase component